MATGCIQVRGAAVHNLKRIDLDIPRRQLVVVCGVSGSGKTSLALDTLYAEGQRRYIESFSTYTRQFLEQLEKPEAERIDGLPPAIAVTRKSTTRSRRATVGTVTETVNYLRLLYAKIGQVSCSGCGREVRRDSPQSAAGHLMSLAEGTRYMLAFAPVSVPDEDFGEMIARLHQDGFVRAIADGRTTRLEDLAPAEAASSASVVPAQLFVIVDRLTAGTVDTARVGESLETAFQNGGARCCAFVEADAMRDAGREMPEVSIDGRQWRQLRFSSAFACENCRIEFPEPEPRLFSFNSPLGACPKCEGFGDVVDIDMERIVPDAGKTLREGAIAPWNTPAYAHELEELIALAGDYDVPLDVPFSRLSDAHLRIIREGVPERDFGGLNGFFAWLEKRKYKMHLRVFLSRWRSYRTCPECGGMRLRPEALIARIGGRHIAEVCRLKIADAREFFQRLELTPWQAAVSKTMLPQVLARLGYLCDVGVGYLSLDRTLATLSGGEAQRVALTSALGSTLVDMLYVLDEPSVGLHPHDVDRLVGAIQSLRDRGNSLIVVEHEESMIRAADQVVEIGPEAGVHGGKVVFQGTPAEMMGGTKSLTGDYLAGRRGITAAADRRPAQRGWVRLTGARGNNLKNVDVRFPLGVLCLVTGVSGSGKSTLVQDTLYGALCRRLRKEGATPLPFDEVYGDGQVDDVVLVDQSPIGRSPRSNPVTYIKAFDQIRAVFADTIEARTHNYTPGHFSFNVDGGRCSKCKGDGSLAVDMQFLADIYMKCDQCDGRRYRREILDVTYRGRNIAEVLEMTVREAFAFFRGQRKVQERLKQLIDVGLDYLRLGQPASTLSAGEAQRLKLAAYMTAARRNRTLFLLDEPTTGLHPADVIKLIDCFDALLAVGHSLIVVEHNLQLMASADWIIDLGPGAAEDGGEVVAEGTPETVALAPNSLTARFLSSVLAKQLREQTA